MASRLAAREAQVLEGLMVLKDRSVNGELAAMHTHELSFLPRQKAAVSRIGREDSGKGREKMRTVSKRIQSRGAEATWPTRRIRKISSNMLQTPSISLI